MKADRRWWNDFALVDAVSAAPPHGAGGWWVSFHDHDGVVVVDIERLWMKEAMSERAMRHDVEREFDALRRKMYEMIFPEVPRLPPGWIAAQAAAAGMPARDNVRSREIQALMRGQRGRRRA